MASPGPVYLDPEKYFKKEHFAVRPSTNTLYTRDNVL